MPRIGEAFGADGDPALNLNIQFTFPPRNPYAPGDQPAYVDDLAARLPRPGRHRRRDRRGAGRASTTAPYPVEDGVDSPDDRDGRAAAPALLPGRAPTTGGDPDNVVRSRQRRVGIRDVLAGSHRGAGLRPRSILAYQTGVDPADVSDLAAATARAAAAGNSVVLR